MNKIGENSRVFGENYRDFREKGENGEKSRDFGENYNFDTWPL